MEIITCKDVMQHICENLGEDDKSERCKAIHEHLAGCNTCSSYFRSVEMTIEFYKKYEVVMPDEAHQKLISLLGIEEPK